MKTLLKVLSPILAIFLVVGGGLFGWNHLVADAPLQRVLDGDPRNAGIEARAHFDVYVRSSALVFDLKQVGPETAPVDVFRVFLGYASAMKAERFTTVTLAYRGTAKFMMTGDYFRQLGEEYGEQNPMYTTRTFAENLLTPEGRPAFDAIDGGVLAVLGAQMEQFGEVHRRWYIDAR